MAASHESVVFDVHDFKLYEMLTDSSAASPTYGAAVDVPGIADVDLGPNLVTAELKGDARIIAKRGRTDSVKASATYGKIKFEALDVFMGGTVTDPSGTSAKYSLVAPAPLPYFKAAIRISDLDVGLADLHVIMYKCQLDDASFLNPSSDNFGQPTVSWTGIAPDHETTPMMDIFTYTVSTALPA